MYQLILLIHVFAAVIIVALVLVQQGKGATLGAAFGSGASQTIFGSRGSGSFLFRITISLAIIFFITSLALNYIATQAYKQERAMNLPISQEMLPREAPVSLPPATQNGSASSAAPVKNNAGQILPNEIPVRK